MIIDHVIKLSRDKWKPLYLNFRENNGYQTWQSGGSVIYQNTWTVDNGVT